MGPDSPMEVQIVSWPTIHISRPYGHQAIALLFICRFKSWRGQDK